MLISSEKIGDILVVVPGEKRIDAPVATDFKSTMVDWINAGHRRLLLDLSGVDLIDSAGLGAILSTLKTLGKDGDLFICGIGKTVKSLFELTRMHRVFNIYPTRDDALEAARNH